MRSIFVIFASLFLSGCSQTFIASAPVVPTAIEWKALLKNIYSTFPNLKMPGSPEISPLHENVALGLPADMAICLRNSGGGDTKYVVFLIKQNKIVDYRFAVILDRCEEQSYSPLLKP
jgi:hypothetical protein